MKTKTDRVILEAKKAYRSTAAYEYDELMAEQSRWLRKQTIANNKLTDVRRRIGRLLQAMVTAAAERGEKHPEKSE